ncbi:MAG: hypothetical protein P4L84_36500 [Isosphaeraceae bacterium]|nr:hypothetical protein [Isosphaeraceae bacterium]
MHRLIRLNWRGAIMASSAALALSGCGSSAPPVSSTTAEATVHGTVKYKGAPVEAGNIRFDPSNIQRRDAKIASAPIGKDGTYKVTTLQGGNVVRFELSPELRKKDPRLATSEKEYDVPSGDSTLDIELAP